MASKPVPQKVLLIGVVAALVSSCAGAPARQARTAPAAAPAATPASIELVESVPVETTLDHTDIADAFVVWPAMIDRAKKSLAIGAFYISDEPGKRLAPVLEAVERAARRGVAVRVMVDQRFSTKYPESLSRLETVPGIQLKRLDVSAGMGGVHHAKYLVVDDRESFIGSQNFDWRALEHIQEMGVRIESPGIARELLAVFDFDWLGKKEAGPGAALTAAPAPERTRTGEEIRLVSSPKGYLPAGATWDLPELKAMLQGARKSVDVQLLTYEPRWRDHRAWDELQREIAAARARGVRVRMLLSEWNEKKAEAIKGLEDAGAVVRILAIPKWSGGDVPFARVVHAKYMVIDGGERAWVGTSNWEADYFYSSRNVGVIMEHGKAPMRLEGVFEDGWRVARERQAKKRSGGEAD